MTPIEERSMFRAIRRLIAQEGLSGEDADLAYEQWERAGYAAIMQARDYGTRKAEREYKRAWKLKRAAQTREG